MFLAVKIKAIPTRGYCQEKRRKCALSKKGLGTLYAAGETNWSQNNTSTTDEDFYPVILVERAGIGPVVSCQARVKAHRHLIHPQHRHLEIRSEAGRIGRARKPGVEKQPSARYLSLTLHHCGKTLRALYSKAWSNVDHPLYHI